MLLLPLKVLCMRPSTEAAEEEDPAAAAAGQRHARNTVVADELTGRKKQLPKAARKFSLWRPDVAPPPESADALEGETLVEQAERLNRAEQQQLATREDPAAFRKAEQAAFPTVWAEISTDFRFEGTMRKRKDRTERLLAADRRATEQMFREVGGGVGSSSADANARRGNKSLVAASANLLYSFGVGVADTFGGAYESFVKSDKPQVIFAAASEELRGVDADFLDDLRGVYSEAKRKLGKFKSDRRKGKLNAMTQQEFNAGVRGLGWNVAHGCGSHILPPWGRSGRLDGVWV